MIDLIAAKRRGDGRENATQRAIGRHRATVSAGWEAVKPSGRLSNRLWSGFQRTRPLREAEGRAQKSTSRLGLKPDSKARPRGVREPLEGLGRRTNLASLDSGNVRL